MVQLKHHTLRFCPTVAKILVTVLISFPSSDNFMDIMTSCNHRTTGIAKINYVVLESQELLIRLQTLGLKSLHLDLLKSATFPMFAAFRYLVAIVSLCCEFHR